jgi:dephospho-CoA kinase
MVIGVSGKYCAGKSTLVSFLKKKDFYPVDVDKLGHDALVIKRESIIACFGRDILGSDGSIDRKALGKIVFARKAKLEELESIVHPVMAEEVGSIVGSGVHGDIVLDAAMLFKMGLERFCDCIIWVKAPPIIRILRALKRDGQSLPRILRRMWSQRKLYPKFSSYPVDIHIVENPASEKRFYRRLEALLSNLRERD